VRYPLCEGGRSESPRSHVCTDGKTVATLHLVEKHAPRPLERNERNHYCQRETQSKDGCAHSNQTILRSAAF